MSLKYETTHRPALTTLGSPYKYGRLSNHRSLASALDGRISKEVCYGKIVDHSFLKIFGYIAYVHVDHEIRKEA